MSFTMRYTNLRFCLFYFYNIKSKILKILNIRPTTINYNKLQNEHQIISFKLTDIQEDQ